MESSPHNIMIDLINLQKKKEENKDIWENSPYKDFTKLQSNNAGIVGEFYIQQLCDKCGITANVDGTKTKKNRRGRW